MTVATVALSVQLFGAPALRRGEHAEVFPCDKRHQLLAYLAYRGEWVSRDQLAELFWSEAAGTAKGNLRSLLGRVQGLPWLTGLEIERSRVRWAVPTDAAEFKQQLAANHLGRALDLYSGPFMRDMDGYDNSEFVSWLEAERAVLGERYRAALLSVVAAQLRDGQAKKVPELLEAFMEQDPFDEEAIQLYLATSAKAGQARGALERYKRFARQLEREFGIEPSSKTSQLAQEAQESLEQEVPAGSRASEPRPSLPPATTKLSSLPTPTTSFVGRDLELAEIANLMLDPACRILSVESVRA